MEQGSNPNPAPLDYARPGLRRSVIRSQLSRVIFWTISLTVIGLLASVLVPSGLSKRDAEYRPKCSMNLRAIGEQLYVFANAHDGKFPGSFSELVLDPNVNIPAVLFVNPESKLTGSPATTPAELANDLATNPKECVSYIYIGRGLSKAAPQDAVLAYEPLGSHGSGFNVLFLSLEVELIDGPRAAMYIAELQAGHNPPRAEMIK